MGDQYNDLMNMPVLRLERKLKWKADLEKQKEKLIESQEMAIKSRSRSRGSFFKRK